MFLSVMLSLSILPFILFHLCKEKGFWEWLQARNTGQQHCLTYVAMYPRAAKICRKRNYQRWQRAAKKTVRCLAWLSIAGTRSRWLGFLHQTASLYIFAATSRQVWHAASAWEVWCPCQHWASHAKLAIAKQEDAVCNFWCCSVASKCIWM